MLLQGHLASPSPQRWISSAGATQQLPALPPPDHASIAVSDDIGKGGKDRDGKRWKGEERSHSAKVTGEVQSSEDLAPGSLCTAPGSNSPEEPVTS